MQLNFNQISLVRFLLSATGEKQMDRENQEVDVPLKLNNEESIQRRFFFKNTQEIVDKVNQEINLLTTAHNQEVEELRTKLKEKNPKKEGLEDTEYNEQINVLVNSDTELRKKMLEVQNKVTTKLEKSNEIKVESKTKKVIKKYFEKYGNDVGFSVADDKVIEELQTILE